MFLMLRGNCPMIWSFFSEGKVSISGNGHKRPKFHAHLHLPTWISELGAPANYNTQQFESNHKVVVKDVSTNVQKRGHDKFLAQIAIRGYERQLLSTAIQKFDIQPIMTRTHAVVKCNNNN